MLEESVPEYLLSVNLELFLIVVTIISVYGPQSGRSEEDKDSFYDELSAELQSKNKNCIVLEDFNGHVGNSINEYKGVHKGYGGWGMRNKNGERLFEFADSFDTVVGNTFFKKEKLFTFKSGGNSSVIDYAGVKKEAMKRVRDVKVIPGEECFPQHSHFVIDLGK